MNHYETIFIVTPVLSEADFKQTVDTYTGFLQNNGAEIVHHENWGLKQLAYEIERKTTGFYVLLQYKAPAELIDKVELNFKRDVNILRFLTTRLDKYAIDYNERRRKGEIGQKEKGTKEKQEA